MEKKGVFTKILAIVGTLLVWLPILAPILFGGLAFFRMGGFLFDYLMPAELFPVEMVGAGLLMWAAMRMHLWQRLIGWGLVSAIVLLAGGQGLAVVTGLAAGETEPAGLWMAIVLVVIILFDLVLVAIGVGGVLLMRELFKRSQGGNG